MKLRRSKAWVRQRRAEPKTPTGGTEARSKAAFDGLNYIRNSVKVVVDMYDGTVRFYVMDPVTHPSRLSAGVSRCVQ